MKPTQFILPAIAILAISAGTYTTLTGSKATATHDTTALQALTTPQASGQTAQQTLAAGVIGDVYTITRCSGGILVKNKTLAILNSHPYKDAANAPIVASATLLNGLDPEALKGKTLIAKGRLGDYNGKPQWLATSLEVK